MLRKSLLTAAFIFLVFSITTKSQTLGGSLMLGSPQKEFGEYVDRLGYGLQVHGTLWTPDKFRPFTVGLNLAYLVYGEESERRPFSHTIPDVFVDVNRTNSLVNFHLLFQVAPFTGTVRPYIEGLFGGAYLFTQTDIESEWNNAEVARTTNFDDYTWSYGGGGGLLIQVGSGLGDVSRLFLDLKARYLLGSEAEYLTEGSIDINPSDGSITYHVSESKTDLLSFHIGVVAYF